MALYHAEMQQRGKRGGGERNRGEQRCAEMADVLFVLICLANQTEVDLEEAFKRNLEKKSIRDAERHHNNPKLKA